MKIKQKNLCADRKVIKMKKRVVATAVAACMLAGMCSGCGKKNDVGKAD